MTLLVSCSKEEGTSPSTPSEGPEITREIPTLVIVTPGYKTVTSKTEWVEGAELSVRNTDGSTEYLGQISIKRRGNSTYSYVKPSYNIKFENGTDLLDMPKGKRWCLLANWMDRTVMRNDVAFEISRRLSGLDWTPRGRYVELEVNGKKLYNYYLTEKIRISGNRVNIDEKDGVLVELDIYYDEPVKFKSSMGLPVMIQDPDDITSDRLDSFKDFFNRAETQIKLCGTSATQYCDYLDPDSFVDYFFLLELTGNREPNWPKSVYMYRDKGGLLFAGPAWDFDWGTFIVNDKSIKNKNSLWYSYLFMDSSFRQLAKQRWNQQKDTLKSIPSYIGQKAAAIRSSALSNSVAWPIGQTVNYDESLSWSLAVEQMKDAYQTRYDVLDKYINSLAD